MWQRSPKLWCRMTCAYESRVSWHILHSNSTSIAQPNFDLAPVSRPAFSTRPKQRMPPVKKIPFAWSPPIFPNDRLFYGRGNVRKHPLWIFPDDASASRKCIVTPSIKLKTVAGKGLGFVAKHPIPAGTLLISEEPLLLGPQTDCVAVASVRPWLLQDPFFMPDVKEELLSRLQKQPREISKAFYALSNPHSDMEPCLGIYRSNALSFRMDPKSDMPAFGVFSACSRLNHSCLPNAHFSWDYDIELLG